MRLPILGHNLLDWIIPIIVRRDIPYFPPRILLHELDVDIY